MVSRDVSLFELDVSPIPSPASNQMVEVPVRRFMDLKRSAEQGHTHFISVLEAILHSLKPLSASKSRNVPKGPGGKKEKKQRSAASSGKDRRSLWRLITFDPKTLLEVPCSIPDNPRIDAPYQLAMTKEETAFAVTYFLMDIYSTTSDVKSQAERVFFSNIREKKTFEELLSHCDFKGTVDQDPDKAIPLNEALLTNSLLSYWSCINSIRQTYVGSWRKIFCEFGMNELKPNQLDFRFFDRVTSHLIKEIKGGGPFEDLMPTTSMMCTKRAPCIEDEMIRFIRDHLWDSTCTIPIWVPMAVMRCLDTLYPMEDEGGNPKSFRRVLDAALCAHDHLERTLRFFRLEPGKDDLTMRDFGPFVNDIELIIANLQMDPKYGLSLRRPSQQRSESDEWPDMETVIAHQTRGHLLLPEIPLEWNQYRRRFTMFTEGMSVMTVAKDARSRDKIGGNPRNLESRLSLCELLHARCTKGNSETETGDFDMASIESILSERKTWETRHPSRRRSNKRNTVEPKEAKSDNEPVNTASTLFLGELNKIIDIEEEYLYFDYACMTFRCHHLLTTLQNELVEILYNIRSECKMDDQGNPTLRPWFVMLIFEELDRLRGDERKRVLTIIVEIMNKFIQEEGDKQTGESHHLLNWETELYPNPPESFRESESAENQEENESAEGQDDDDGVRVESNVEGQKA
ncbi:hypothetical protein M501DRAFT_1033984 [Patellaria atrata CBS 101060]|uniref:Uncharacterized protein n=1 Tax=Patellaria atrata CBS 101060 TaxID=1346257 RepID=A0A9P4S564_9PEZI|nr:hypothetical protein M501DRAFT_1033984 [Patellaria atrata CBS 101060]